MSIAVVDDTCVLMGVVNNVVVVDDVEIDGADG